MIFVTCYIIKKPLGLKEFHPIQWNLNVVHSKHLLKIRYRKLLNNTKWTSYPEICSIGVWYEP